MSGKPMVRDFLKGAQQKNKATGWGVGLNL